MGLKIKIQAEHFKGFVINTCQTRKIKYSIGYGDPSNTTILKYTISDVYLFGQHVSTLLLGHFLRP
jgi:hypothetical protein